MTDLQHLFESNRSWSQKIRERDPDFFEKLSKQQTPEYLWIGCSDSRVPANEIVDLLPGELFVHRNVANVVVHTDLNCLSVIQYAVEALHVKHIIVCGHYGCGGIKAALENSKLGLIDNWLRHIQDVMERHETTLKSLPTPDDRFHRLCELNVMEQAINVCQTTIVQSAWHRGQELTIHGWIYGLSDGLIHDLNVSAGNAQELKVVYERVKRA
jgi:carbonic anhydrase